MGVHSFFLALNTNNHGRDEITIEIQGRQDEAPAPVEDENQAADEIDDIEW